MTSALPFVMKDRKSTRLNSSHLGISYAVFCLKKNIKRKETDLAWSCKFIVSQLWSSASRPRALRSGDCDTKMFMWIAAFFCVYFFFFNDTAPTEIYTLSLHDALPI